MKPIQTKLWKLCREITFKRYGNVCYTCGARNLEKQNRQCGHLFPKGSLGALLKYDLRILRPQCFRCNINLGGNGAVFYEKMLMVEGKKYMTKLEKDRIEDKKENIKAKDHYLKLIDEYEGILKGMS